MLKFIDLTGQRFGKLLVVESVVRPEHIKGGKKYWLCKCDCGNNVITSGSNLRNDHTESCGCGRVQDITGKVFSRLTVIKQVQRPENVKNKESYWMCKCECGKEIIVNSGSLKNGHTNSCGCYHLDKISIKHGQAAINSLINGYIRSAKERNLDFDLSKEEFLNLTKQNCYYCGKEPSQISTNKSKINNGIYIYNGVDRVDSSVGYTLDNCVPCCKQCNIAKMTQSKTDFLSWVKRIYEYSFLNKNIITN